MKSKRSSSGRKGRRRAVKSKRRKIHPPLTQIFGIRFRKIALLDAALGHPSYRNETLGIPDVEDYDRLEFLGDSNLNFVICRKLYKLYPKANEGLLSRLRSIIVSRKILARVAGELGLGKYLRLGNCLKNQLKFSKHKIYADSLEALIAAIYFDRGLAQAERFILEHFGRYLESKRLFRLDPNPKSTLQEISQREWQLIPVYASETTPKGVKTKVSVGPERSAAAVSKTRKDSEEKAARLLVRKIRQELLRRSKRYSSGRKLRKIF